MLESLANTVMSRIEDVLYADALTQDPSLAVAKTQLQSPQTPTLSAVVAGPGEEEADRLSSASETPSAPTLSDFMGWNVGTPETETMKKKNSSGNMEVSGGNDEEEKITSKSANSTIKKYLYIDKIEISGLRCPTSRH